ncbi:MAG: AlpA family transcriptional regulator [Gammaproteobacteria bacterium]|nr:AlpA family transcriptional regulator [Gammaproteobacteria bacterium]MYC51273.1 AlpA family transcriptional regulator [Gammaproteobacteria bacterium]
MSEHQTQPRTTSQIRFVRLREVMARTGLSRSTIYVMMAEGRFPKPVPLGERSVGWIESELEEWLRDRIAAR